ncbi:hypothetical protein [Dactylosporangium sp. NPDC050588]|uniref:hypothetical protein n=1 Tax=Dactylosporangium sp. NPDC050588 TaxID=3157211 RepID=UPI00340919CB
MTRVLARVGDKMLGSLLRKEEAGACIDCAGPCANFNGYACRSGVWSTVTCVQYYTCDCGCQVNWSRCTYGPKIGTC